MNNTKLKQTEIGEIPNDWEVIEYHEATLKDSSDFQKLKTKEYRITGKYPIVDQGQELIAGYTDYDDTLYKGEVPVIIFGDHTLIVKYIDFKFAVGADGTKVIKTNPEKFTSKFFYYAILSLNLRSEGYKRHFSKLREQLFVCPPIQEQQKITTVLSCIDSAIQQTDEVIAQARVLKKGLMQELLTQGIGHKKFKQTEIGEIPEEWELSDIESLVTESRNGFASGARDPNGVVQLRMNNLTTDGRMIFDTYLKVPIPEKLDVFLLRPGDFLFNNTNSVDLVGKSAVYNGSEFPCVFSNHFTRIRFDGKKVLPEIILYNVLRFWRIRYFRSIAIRHVGQAAVSPDDLLSLTIAVPPPSEQKQIVDIVQAAEKRIGLELEKRSQLESLKKGLMQDLLTGRVRFPAFVNRLEGT